MSEVAPYTSLRGTVPAEQDCSPRLDHLINATCLRKLDLAGGERILDVGSGFAAFARAMARMTGTPVVCVESDESRIYRSLEMAEADGEGSLIDARQGDARDIPLRKDDWGSFDVVHCRFLLERLSRPQEIVESLARALRPGGRLVLADNDHDVLRMWPAMPAVDELWRALIRSFVDEGFDPFVGRKLPAMMQAADLEPMHVDSLFFGGCSGSPTWDLVMDNLVGKLLGARPEILESSAIPAHLFDEVMESLTAWAGRQGSTLWFQICWAEAIKPT
jgi:SAM-dependent methyltransferase